MFLVGANSCWRTGAYALSYTVNRRCETVPTNRADSGLIGRVQVCNLNLAVGTSDTQLNSHNAQKYINLQVQVGTRCTVSLLEPATGNRRATL